MPTIALLDVTTPQRAEQLRALLPSGFTFTHGTEPGNEAMKALIRDAEYAISGQVAVTAEILRAAPRLKLLHKWGVGIDNLDIAAAKELGIQVARTTGSNALPVAEFTIGLMISALRFSTYGHHKLMQGEWHGPGKLPGETMLLSGKTVGIIGLGAIGTRVATLLRGFGCEILYAKRTPLSQEAEQALGVRHATLGDILTKADVVSLHCPLTPETTNLINAAAFARMKPTAVLVNVARGGVVNEDDLVIALRTGAIRGAAMDVFSLEPLPATSPLVTLDNIVVTPHLAAVTADTFESNVRRMFDNIARCERGEPVRPGDQVV